MKNRIFWGNLKMLVFVISAFAFLLGYGASGAVIPTRGGMASKAGLDPLSYMWKEHFDTKGLGTNAENTGDNYPLDAVLAPQLSVWNPDDRQNELDVYQNHKMNMIWDMLARIHDTYEGEPGTQGEDGDGFGPDPANLIRASDQYWKSNIRKQLMKNIADKGYSDKSTGMTAQKRSPMCLRQCMAQGRLHPGQCHSLC